MRFLVFALALLALSFSELEGASPFARNAFRSQPQAETGSPVGECPPTDGLETTFLADSEDASTFYICNGGSPVKSSCPGGLAFDAATSTCIEPQVYAPVGKCPPVDGEFVTLLPDSDDRTIFYMCHAGNPILKHCPSNLVFDPSKNVCVYDNKKASTRANGKCPEIDGEFPTILPDKDSCSSYYVCFGGEPFPGTCPEGLLFNPEKSYCDFPSNVECPRQEQDDSRESEN